MAKSDYKTKYLDMRAKFLEASDVSYRLGYADGLKDGAQQAQEQAMQEQQMMEQQAMMGGGAPGEEGAMPPGAEGEVQDLGPEDMAAGAGEEEGAGDDMDNHISELENLVAKGEKPSVVKLRKAVRDLVGLRKSQKDRYTSKKQARTSSAQKKFVDSIIEKFDKNTKSVTADLEDVIKEHGLKIKED